MSILLDFPTRPTTGAPDLLDLLPVVLGLREALARDGEAEEALIRGVVDDVEALLTEAGAR